MGGQPKIMIFRRQMLAKTVAYRIKKMTDQYDDDAVIYPDFYLPVRLKL